VTPSKVSKRVIADRLEWIEKMVAEIRALPTDSYDSFSNESKNIWAAESCLRRALEALLDLGRHILAKSYGIGVAEYKQIAEELGQKNVLSEQESMLLRTLAGYRNRMVHFYHDISPQELYAICSDELDDILRLRDAFVRWIKANSDRIDNAL